MITASYVKDVAMQNMEMALMIWLKYQIQKRIPIDINNITNKALMIYEKNYESVTSSVEKKLSFSASRGRFERNTFFT